MNNTVKGGDIEIRGMIYSPRHEHVRNMLPFGKPCNDRDPKIFTFEGSFLLTLASSNNRFG